MQSGMSRGFIMVIIHPLEINRSMYTPGMKFIHCLGFCAMIIITGS